VAQLLIDGGVFDIGIDSGDTGTRGLFPRGAVATEQLSIGRPGTAGVLQFHGDSAQVVIASTDSAPAPGQAHV